MTSSSLATPPCPPTSSNGQQSRYAPAVLAAILAEIAAGDSTRFPQFYAATHPTVSRAVRRVLLCPEQSAEVTQEVYLQVWLQADRFDPARGAALGWLTTMARRRAVDRVRTAQASVVRDDAYVVDDTTSAVDSVWGDVVRRSDASLLREALNRLSTVQREALVLTYFRGHTSAEVAVLLDRPIGTVKTRLRDGLLNLRRVLVPGFAEVARSPVLGVSELVFLPVRTEQGRLQSVA